MYLVFIMMNFYVYLKNLFVFVMNNFLCDTVSLQVIMSGQMLLLTYQLDCL